MGSGSGRADHGATISHRCEFAMSRLPPLTVAAMALLLLAAMPARANETASAAPAEAAAAAASPEASAAERSAEKSEPPLVVDSASWRDSSSSSRPAKRWAASAEVDSSSYRVSLSRGKFDMGMGFEAPMGVATRTARSVDPSGPIVATLPSLSVGLRSDTAGPPPSSLIERARAEATTPSSTRRVGLEWKPAQSSVFVRGGLRLTGDDRVTMRVKSGRVGVYMKSTF